MIDCLFRKKRRKLRKLANFYVSLFLVLSVSFFSGNFIQLIKLATVQKVHADEEDVFVSWNFTTPSDYDILNTNLLEVKDNSARLKVREYEDDSKTSALYHFNETSGTTAEDSSSNNKDGVVRNANFNPTQGVLNGQLEFNGSSSLVSVSASEPSSPLHFSPQHSLESWVTFSEDFQLTANGSSNGKEMGILDKGSYKLYFDEENGRLTYEIASSAASSWTQIAGGGSNEQSINNSWDRNGQQAVTAVEYYQNLVYVGLGSGQTDAEVWRWDGNNWAKIGGDGVGWGFLRFLKRSLQWKWTEAVTYTLGWVLVAVMLKFINGMVLTGQK
ncbi:MAG: hypothetical protein KatS3mg087_1481 [Patescibacteria group bacterium]|nr:MAG: hypothetical protein KatS3mg087_1481 [Patescibacteria group bacterium]